MRPVARSLAFCSFAFLVSACGYPRVWREAEQEFEVSTAGVKNVECTTANGSIGVDGAAPDSVCRVKVKRRGGGEDATDAEAALAAIRVVNTTVNGALKLGWEWATPKQTGWGASVSFTLLVPKDRTLQLETSNGAIAVAGLEAPVAARTSNGSVKLDQCKGDWDVVTSNGPIEASGAPATLSLKTSNGSIAAKLGTKGPVNGKLKTSNGRVDLALAAEASTRVKAETSNGSITTEGDWKIHTKGKTQLDASRQGGNGTLMVDTSNGSIRIE